MLLPVLPQLPLPVLLSLQAVVAKAAKVRAKTTFLETTMRFLSRLKIFSNHWTDPKAGPELPDEHKPSTEDVINAADATVPVAAMIKILQSLEENVHDVSLLLAGLRAPE